MADCKEFSVELPEELVFSSHINENVAVNQCSQTDIDEKTFNSLMILHDRVDNLMVAFCTLSNKIDHIIDFMSYLRSKIAFLQVLGLSIKSYTSKTFAYVRLLVSKSANQGMFRN